MPTVTVRRTYLEMTTPAALRPSAPPASALRVERVTSPDVALYRALYRDVGERYHWRDRLAWSDEELAAYLARPEVSLWVLSVGGQRGGFFELRAEPRGAAPAAPEDEGESADVAVDVEIVYFGLAGPYIGRGLGKYLLTRAVEEAWRTPGARRVWLHTCTLDDRAALPNYLARGFAKVREETYEAEM